MSKHELLPFDSDDALAQEAARQWLELVQTKRNSAATVAFSGGRIARKFFAAAALACAGNPTALNQVHIFWADERCVPPEDAESNFLLARQGLFDPLEMNLNHVHRIEGELRPEEAARRATEALIAICPQEKGIPVLDLVFLGMGEDGHIASLFPGTEIDPLGSEPLFRPVIASKPPPHRITMGYRVLEAARQVWVLASGKAKESALKNALDADVKNPLGRLLNLRSHTRIFSDIS